MLGARHDPQVQQQCVPHQSHRADDLKREAHEFNRSTLQWLCLSEAEPWFRTFHILRASDLKNVEHKVLQTVISLWIRLPSLPVS